MRKANALLSKNLLCLFLSVCYLVLREYEANECLFEIDILFVFSPTVILNFFYQGRNYFRAYLFPSQVPKIYPRNGVLTRRVKIR